MALTKKQEDVLKKFADNLVAEEEDIVVRTAIIDAEVRTKNIEMGIITEEVVTPIVEEIVA